MIAELLAATLGFQAAPQADLTTVIRDLPAWCERREDRSTTFTTSSGDRVTLTKSALACGAVVQPWVGDRGETARIVETFVAPTASGWYAIRRREPVLNESGPTRWSEFEHEIAGFVRLIEPEDGVSGTLTLELLAGD